MPNYPITKLFNPTLGLLQNRNLSGVIKLVLRDSVQHVIKVVPFAGNALPEA